MTRTKVLLFAAVFGLSVAVGFYLFKSRSSQYGGNFVEVDWRLLGEMDYVTGKGNSELEALDGKEVKIPGFMVPLEDNMRKVSQFLLVPSPQACIHVPPPPPNQMVLVDMEKGQETEVAFGPIWIMGRLSMKPKRHMYGESSFTMTGLHVEPYR